MKGIIVADIEILNKKEFLNTETWMPNYIKAATCTIKKISADLNQSPKLLKNQQDNYFAFNILLTLEDFLTKKLLKICSFVLSMYIFIFKSYFAQCHP